MLFRSTGTTIVPEDDTIPQNTEGDEYMSISFTPTNASSLLRIEVTAFLTSTATTGSMIGSLFQDSIANALASFNNFSGANGGARHIHIKHHMISGTTNTITFKFRAGQSVAGTTTFNGIAGSRNFGGTIASSITITELR